MSGLLGVACYRFMGGCLLSARVPEEFMSSLGVHAHDCRCRPDRSIIVRRDTSNTHGEVDSVSVSGIFPRPHHFHCPLTRTVAFRNNVCSIEALTLPNLHSLILHEVSSRLAQSTPH